MVGLCQSVTLGSLSREKAMPLSDSEMQKEDNTWVGSAARASAPSRGLRPGMVVSNRYRVGSLIGAGGMSLVYEAEHLLLGARVALKVLRPELIDDRERVELFTRESRCLARLAGEHVVRVMDAGRLETGLPFIILERLEGLDLQAMMQRCPTLPVEVAVHYARQACAGLASAHAQGIVHGDIKPANLFLVSDSTGHGRIKVIDFGIARSTSNSPPADDANEVLLGSPPYAAPEQFESARDIDARTDVWALGVVLFEMLAGRSPFDVPADSATRTRNRVAPVRRWRPEVSAQLQAVVERCLDERKGMRFASVQALSDALIPFDVEPRLDELETVEDDANTPRLDPPRLCRSRRTQRSVPAVRRKAGARFERWELADDGPPARGTLRLGGAAGPGSPSPQPA
jgi:serine/threonine protein kinase